jgi:hypothetical protein
MHLAGYGYLDGLDEPCAREEGGEISWTTIEFEIREGVRGDSGYDPGARRDVALGVGLECNPLECRAVG